MRKIILWLTILVICISVVTIFSFSGCKKGTKTLEQTPAETLLETIEETSGETKSGEITTKEITITFADGSLGEEQSKIVDNVVKIFEERYSNIKIKRNSMEANFYKQTDLYTLFAENVRGPQIIIYHIGKHLQINFIKQVEY